MATAELKSSLQKFVTFVTTRVTGDEKSETQGLVSFVAEDLGLPLKMNRVVELNLSPHKDCAWH